APADELPDALEQCFNVARQQSAPVQNAVAAAADHSTNPYQPFTLERGLLRFWISQHRLPEAAVAWAALARVRLPPSAAEQVQVAQQLRRDATAYLISLVAADLPEQAARVWSEGVQRGLFDPREGPGLSDYVTNGDFVGELAPGPLNWQVCSACGPWISRIALEAPLVSVTKVRRQALSVEFRGGSPGNPLLQQSILLEPSTAYELSAYSMRTDAGQQTGVSLQLVNQRQRVCARLNLPRAGRFVRQAATLTTGRSREIYTLEIDYDRPIGQMLLRGTQLLTGISLRRAPVVIPLDSRKIGDGC
ncbi:MAG: hypothetical protein ACRD1L_13315, partial [Terriglobales bacterium]